MPEELFPGRGDALFRKAISRDSRSSPPQSDAGNRISLAGLRACAVTRDSDFPPGQRGIARAIRLIWNDLSIACDDSRESGRGDVRDG